MRLAFAILAASVLAACESTPPETPIPPPAKPLSISDARDCAVIIAVVREQYKPAPGTHLRIQRGDPTTSDDFRITCDFRAAGLPIDDYDYGHKNKPGDFQGWLSFSKPTYPASRTAKVDTGYLIAPLAGAGHHCTVSNEGGVWRLQRCEVSWVS